MVTYSLLDANATAFFLTALSSQVLHGHLRTLKLGGSKKGTGLGRGSKGRRWGLYPGFARFPFISLIHMSFFEAFESS